jgi:ribosomal protein S11
MICQRGDRTAYPRPTGSGWPEDDRTELFKVEFLLSESGNGREQTIIILWIGITGDRDTAVSRIADETESFRSGCRRPRTRC